MSRPGNQPAQFERAAFSQKIMTDKSKSGTRKLAAKWLNSTFFSPVFNF
jgi:hypothetical protein